MLKKLILGIFLIALVLLGIFYLTRETQDIDIDVDEDIPNDVEEVEEITEETEIQEWTSFENPEFNYTAEYPQNWELDTEDYERVWFYDSQEEVAILFASSIATQTGFPEYEMISMYETTVDNQEATISLLYSDMDRAIISVFESENYPHFTMMTYQCETGAEDEKMLELNEEFLGRITLQ